MCANIWHHNGDLKAGMWQQFNMELAQKYEII
jgi:hypothetical protein